MVLKEVTQLTTEKEYEVISKQYLELKQHIKDCIEFEDFEVLSSYDLTKIKELHFTKSALFWKIKVQQVDERMAEIKQADPFHYQHNVEYCQLAVKKFEYYAEQKQAELKGNGDYYSFNKHHKPVIDNRILEWKMRLESSKKLRKMETSPRKIEVIP